MPAVLPASTRTSTSGADAFHAAPGFDPTRQARRRRMAGREAAPALGRSSMPSRAAAQQAGIPRIDDFNRGDNEGVGYFEVNQRAGMRWNAAKAFLRPVRSAPNLQVWTGAHVSRVLLEPAPTAGRARVGVEALPAGGGRRRARALRAGGEVCSRAGAIGTPQILQLSGIGPAGAAAAPRHRRRARPAGRRREPAGPPADPRRLRRRGRADAQHDGADALWGKAHDRPANTRCERSGPMSMAPSQLGAFTRSDPSAAAPEPRVPRAAALARRLRRAAASLQRLHRERVQPQPDQPRPRAHPLGRRRRRAAHRAATTSRTEDDRQVAAESLRLTRRIVAQPALAPYRAERGQARACSSRATPSWRSSPATSARRSSIRSAPPRWARRATRRRWSMRACACTASPGCASSTPA